MNGKIAKRLRRAFGTGAQYRYAKRQVDTVPTSMAQRPKVAAPQRVRAREGSPPTWPRTADQRAQSRPLVVVHPRRHVDHTKRKLTKLPEKLDRLVFGFYPKHFVDGYALRHPKGV